MITAVHESVPVRKRREDGFTLIELLVVVLIIGILAAIAIPVFVGRQEKAEDSRAMSDLGNAKTALVSYDTAHDGTLTSTGTDLSTYGYVKSQGVSAVGILLDTDNDASFCLSAKSETGNWFALTESKGVAAGYCAEHAAFVAGNPSFDTSAVDTH